LTNELTEVISRNKFKKYFPLGVDKYIAFYKKITVYYQTITIFNSCADPKDNYLFDLAYQTHSNYLVSGDRKVLDTLVNDSLKLLTLTAFKREIN
jgi:putative PIN family toxin of toxin-antitoxin system